MAARALTIFAPMIALRQPFRRIAMRPIIIIAAIAALSACSNEKSTTVTTADGKEVKITADGANSAESGTITFEGKDGEGGKITFGKDAAKQGLPLGLPVYPGGEVQGAFNGGSQGESGGMATVMTSAAPADVIAFYKAEAEKMGMTVQSTATMSGKNATFAAEGADKSSLMVTATPGEGGKTAAVIIGGKKN
jgi:hypothetical protein